MEKIDPIISDKEIRGNGRPDIPGWGIDADPEDHPNYPMKNYTGDDHNRLNYERAPQQETDVELLKSIERPVITRVFGTSTPPSGISGSIRRFAFKYSEGDARHWFSLVLADRINVVEGIVDDLKQGHIPNLIGERGWGAEWKYNRENFVKKIAVTAAVTGVAIWMLTRGKKKKSLFS